MKTYTDSTSLQINRLYKVSLGDSSALTGAAINSRFNLHNPTGDKHNLFQKFLGSAKTMALVIVLLFMASFADAQRFAVATGNWNAAIWATTAGGAAGSAATPIATDAVTINSGVVVTVNTAGVTCASITVTAPTAINGITLASPGSLAVTGAITMNSPSAGTITSTIAVADGTLSAASIAIPGSGTAGRFCTVSVSTGTINVTGNITFSGTAAQSRFTFTGAGTLNVGGTFTGGTFTASTGTVNYNGAAQNIGVYTFYNLSTSGSGTKTTTGTNTVGGALSVGNGTTLSVGAFAFTVTGTTTVGGGTSGVLSITSATGAKAFNGDLTIASGGTWNNNTVNLALTFPGSISNSGTFNTGTGVQTLSGTGKTITGTFTIPSLTISGSYTNNGTLTIGTALTGGGSLTQGATGVLNLGGTTTITALDAATNPGNTVNYTGAGQNIFNTTYDNLTMSGSGIAVFAGSETINALFTISSGQVRLPNGSGSYSASLILSPAAAVTSGIYGSTGSTATNPSAYFDPSTTGLLAVGSSCIPGTWTGANSSAWNDAGNWCGGVPTATTDVFIPSLSALILNSPSITLAGAVCRNITIQSGTALTITGSNTLTVAGSWTNNGAFTFNTSKVIFSGTGAIGGTTPAVFYDLSLTGSGTITPAIATTVNHNLVIGDGMTLTAGGFALTVAGSTTVGAGASGILNLTSATGAKTFTGDVSVAAGGTWNNNTVNLPLTFPGSLSNLGTFNAGTGLQTLSGTGKTISGAFSIPSLIISGSYTNGGTLTAATALTVNTGASLTNNGTVTATTLLTVTGTGAVINNGTVTATAALSGTGTLTQGTTGILNLGGTAGITTLTATAVGNTVNYTGAAQTANTTTTYYNLTLSGSLTKTFNSAITVNNIFSIAPTGTAVAGLATGTNSFAVGSLVLGGTTQTLPGSYGGTNSAADNINTTYFATSTGKVYLGNCVTGTWTGGGADGLWETPGNWCGGVPLSTTNVIIPTGIATYPTINSAAVCKSLTLSSAAVLSIAGSNSLTVSGGNWTNNGGTFNTGTGQVNFTGTSAIGGSASTTFYDVNLTGTAVVTTGISTTINHNLSIGDGTTLATGAVALTVTGTTTVGGGASGVLSASGGTKTFTSAVIINTGGAITESAASTLAFGSDVTILGTLSESGVAASSFAGNLTNNGIYTAGSGAHTFTGSAKTIGGSSANVIPTATFTGNYTNSGTLTSATALTINLATLTNDGTITATAALSGSGGLTQDATGILNIGGTSLITTLSATTAGNTVTYSGATQTVKAVNYANLTLTGGAKTFTVAETITGTLSIATSAITALPAGTNTLAGILILNGTTQSLPGSYGATGNALATNQSGFFSSTGLLYIGSCISGYWTGAAADGLWETPGNWCNSVVPGVGTDVLLPAGTAPYPTINSAAQCKSITLNTGSTLTIAGTNSLTLNGGNWTNNGGTFTPGTGQVTFAGSGTIGGSSNPATFYDLSLTGTAVVTPSVVTNITHNLSIGDGTTFTSGAFALTVTGTTTIGGGTSGALTITSATGTKTFNGPVTINSGGALTETVAATLAFGSDVTISGTLTESGAAAVSFAGNVTNNGVYTAGTGAHNFSGSAMTIGGSTANVIPTSTFTGSYTNSGILTAATALTITGNTLTNNGTITATTALSGTGGLTQGATGILNINNTATISTLTASASGNLVNYTGAAQTVNPVIYDKLTLSGSGIKTLTGLSTVNSDLSLSGTATATTAAALAIGGNLNIGNGTTFTAPAFALTVTGTTTIGTGTSGTLNLTGATGAKALGTVVVNGGTGAVNITGVAPVTTTSITINAGGTWSSTTSPTAVAVSTNITNGGSFTNSVASTYTLGGNLTNNGTTFTSGSGVYTLNGSVSTVGGIQPLAIPNLVINGTYTNNGALTISGSFSGTGTLSQDNGSTLNLNFTGSPSITSLVAIAPGNTVNYGFAGTQNIFQTSYANLTLSNSGIKTFQGPTTMSEYLTISGSAKADLGTFTHTSNDLILGGAQQLAGSYGGTGTSGTTINTTFFAANSGVVNVASGQCTLGTWLGLTGDWNTGTNWCGGVIPTSTTDVLIPAGTPNNPTLSAAASCRNITISSNVILTAGANTLSVYGTWTNSGTFAGGTGTVIFAGSGVQSISGGTTFSGLTLQGTGTGAVTFETGTTTINGILSLENGNANSFSSGAFLTYGPAATLQYNAGTASLTAGAEWPNRFDGTGGVIIKGSGGIITLGSSKQIGNNTSVPLTINSGGILTLTGGVATTLTVDGNLIVGGTLNGGSSILAISGTTAAQTISGFTSAGTTVTMTKTAGVATLSGAISAGALTINGNGASLDLGSFIHTFTGNFALSAGTLLGNTSTLTIGGATNTFTAGATFTPGTGLVNYNLAGAQSVANLPYYNLTLSGSGAKALTATSSVANLLSMEGTATATGTVPTYAAGSTLQYASTTGAQTTGVEFLSPFTGTGGVIINNTSGTAVVTLGAAKVITNNLTLTAGVLTTGALTLQAGSASRVAGWVNGNLTLSVATGSSVTKTFPIGNATAYIPVNVVFASVTAAGTLLASTTAGQHPNIATATSIQAAKDVARSWTLTAGGALAFTTATATLGWLPADIIGAANTSNFIIGRYSAGWTYPLFINRTATSIDATNITAFGSFAVGENVIIPSGSGVITTSGTWTVPVGVTSIDVYAWGAGGGGGAAGGPPDNVGGTASGGGGGGGGLTKQTLAVVPGTVYTITIGAGGAVADLTAGVDGGNTIFSLGATNLVIGNGGKGGAFAQNNATTVGVVSAGGAGGAGTYAGGAGASGTTAASGGGGGGAGDTGAGSAGSNAAGGAGGPGTISAGGIGGKPATLASSTGGGESDGFVGTAPGGGGGGGFEGAGQAPSMGGAGSRGQVSISWSCPPVSGSVASITSAASPVCAGNGSLITVTTTGMAAGTYNITYTLTGGYTGGGTSTLSVAALNGTGTFTTQPIMYAGTTATTTTLTISTINCTPNQALTTSIALNPAPTPTITSSLGAATTICVGTPVTYTTQASQTNYVWTLGTQLGVDYTITGPTNTNTLTVTWLTDVADSVMVNYQNGSGCVGIIPGKSMMKPYNSVVAAGTITGTPAVCQGKSFVYKVPVITNATSYVWNYSGVGIGTTPITTTADSITINFTNSATAGNLTVQGNGPCGLGAVSPVYPIAISVLPDAAGIITGPATACISTSGNAYTVPAINNATGYTWAYTGSGATITGGTTNSVTVAFSASATSGNLTVLGTDACGNGPISSFPITISSPPVAAFTASTTSISLGTAVNFFDNSGGGIPTSWTWSFPGATPGSSTDQNPTNIVYGTPGTYIVTFTATNGCGSSTKTSSASGGSGNIVVDYPNYTTAGNYTFTVPPGVSSITVSAWGAGGAGGSGNSSNAAMGGGGGGAFATKVISPVTPGTTYLLTVGAGGLPNGVSTTPPTTAGQSFFGNGTAGNSFGSQLLAASGSFGTSAIGGTGGSSASCLPVAGAYSGGNGAAPAALSSGGGGGGSAGGGGTGTNAGSPVNASPGLGGAAGTLYVGASGGAGGSSNANGIAGNVPGGGGGGKGNLGAQSGKGADGLVYVTWPCVAVNVSNFSITAVTACTGSTSRVTVTSTSMASGVYMITYTLGGANASGPTFATLTFSGTTGYFDTALLPSSGATSVTVSNVNCTAVSSGSTANFTVNASPSPTFTAQAGSSVCVGVDVTYTTQAGQTNYVWVVPGVLNTDYSITSGGIGTTSNSVTLKWLTAGSKTVTINYSNANGCAAATATSSTVTTVNALAAPSFTAQPGASACISTDVTYTTQSGQTNYIWVVPGTLNTDYTITTGGIGTTSNTVTLQWITTGSKTVTINYSNPSGCSTAAATSSTATTVYALPVPSFTAEPGATACAGTDVTYTTQSGQTNYLWSVPGTLNTDYTITSGGIGTTSNSITLKWLTTGSKSVSINYTNPGGCSATSATTGIATTVNASPSPAFTAQAGAGICVGVDVTYTTESGQNNYAWVVPGTLNTDYSITSGGLGASSNTVTLKWLTTGSKTVTINYKNSNGCSAATPTSSVATTVNSLAAPTFITQPGAKACAGIDVTYTTESGQSNYVWVVPGILNADYSITSGGVGPTDNTVTLQWKTTGSKTVTVNYNNSTGCSAATSTSSTATTVSSPPTPTFTVQPGANACIGIDVTYTTQSGGGQANYIWGVPGTLNTDYSITSGGIGTTNSSVTLKWLIAGGSRIVTVNYDNASGCTGASSASSTPTTINPLPSPTFTSQAGSTVCEGIDVTYTTQSGQSNYIWGVPGTLNTDYTITSGGTGTSSNSVTLKWLTTGNKTVTINYTNGNGCSAATATSSTSATVNGLPAPSFTVQPGATACVGINVTYATQSGESNYTWVLPGTLNTDYLITSGGIGTSSSTVTLQWLTSGSKIVTINYNNAGGCPAAAATSSTATIVNALPAPTFTVQPGSSACVGSDVTYTTQTGQTNYTWVVPGVLNTDYSITSGGIGITNNSVTLKWLTTGSKTVTINYNNANGCSAGSATSSTATTVNPTPTIAIQTAATCAPNLLSYSVSVIVNGGTVTSGGVGTIANVGNVWTISGILETTTSVVLTVNNGSCQSSLTVNAPNCNCPVLNAPVSGGNPQYCAGTTVPSVSATVGAGETVDWYAAATGGTVLTGGAGTLTYSPGTAGTYYAETRNTTSACTSSTRTAVTITLNALPTATIAYTGTPYCGIGTATVTQTGPAAGVFSSTAGLSINGSTGDINLAASTAGSYTVTYTFTNGTCQNSATTGVVINALPTAAISYPGSPYCATGTAAATRTGQAGGVYSSTTGLALDVATGAIDLTNSTPGLYTVNYDYTNGTCTSSVSTSLTINPLPTVEVITGVFDIIIGTTTQLSDLTTGGVWSSSTPAVASINASTGLVTSHAVGSATITYTYTNGNTCSSFVTQLVTVSPTGGILRITPIPLHKAYGTVLTNGSVSSSYFTVTGLVGGDLITDVDFAYLAAKAANSPVGTYKGKIDVSSAVGNASFNPSNYTIFYTAGDIIIDPVPLTVTANDTTKTFGKILTGGPGSKSFTSSGLVNGETIGTVTMAYGPGALANAPAGPYYGQVIPSVATGGTSFVPGNYIITYKNGSIYVGQTGELTIIANKVSKTYGTGLFGHSLYSGISVIGSQGEAITVDVSYSSGGLATDTAGIYKGAVLISNAQNLAADYTKINYVSGDLTVNPKALSIIANSKHKPYGTTIVAPGVGAHPSEFSVSGLVNGQSITSATVNYGPGDDALDPVNTYFGSITVSAPVGNSTFNPKNYAITYSPGDITVDPLSLTITALGVSKPYGTTLSPHRAGLSEFSYNKSQLVNGDSIGTVAISYGTGASAGSVGPKYLGSVIAAYPVGAKFNAGNYTITYVPGDITITKGKVTVTADTRNKCYDGLVYSGPYSYTAVGLAPGDVLSGTPVYGGPGGPGTIAKTPGLYPITIGGFTSNPLYDITYPAAGGNLSINELPSATVVADTAICAGAGLNIGASSGAGTRNYSWTSSTPGETLANQPNPYVTPAVNTTYTLVETITATGCTNHHSTLVTVKPQLTANAGPDQEICFGGTVTIGTPGVAGNTYTWTNGDGAVVSNLANPTLSPQNGTFYTLTVSKPGSCSATDGVLVNVIPKPSPHISAVPSANLVCFDSEVVYTTESGMFGYAWTWSGGTKIAGGASTDNSVTIKWNVEGTQKVTVTYSSGPNCATGTIAESTLSISSAPAAPGAISGLTAICAPSNNVVYSVAPITGVSSYVWSVSSPGATIISGQFTSSITVNFDATATAGTVSVYGQNDCRAGATSSLAYELTQKPLAAGIITGEPNFVLNSSGVYSVSPVENATDYTWTVPSGVTITKGVTPNIVTLNFGPAAVAGDLYVVGTNSCPGVGDKSPVISLTVPPKSSIIYPVPNSGIFRAKITFPEETTFNIAVYDPLGNMVREILDAKTSQGVYDQEINLGSVSSGLYVLLFYNSKIKIEHKIQIHK